ncbi:N-6 DNA methylase [Acinetobacter baumannii]|uniref:N-6 DNA methylase n=1 Tax=Acinetobacter baumannii TaxID=470 RepID=UPI0019013617|nr:N-6 DNA methylase [Acinetobacter baumannii]MBJ9483544.1 N-6 DNA methylase [Acinetobacter baumannii]MBJ9910736.1 N-6 DNA methylase [Acinetobacter baumannii]MBJ9945544.1 N-6 DNA methylase [Acinetobacter baumannii]MDV4328669.1 N-6 DNA methylase [Acinetobacter baumannii]MDV4331565.1 N-6 DNA methylase [Acinetobacter baumannii]
MKFKSEQTYQKLRGGYYTPESISAYINQWVITEDTKDILEPSCGDGSFFKSLQDLVDPETFVVNGFELDPREAQKAEGVCQTIGLSHVNILNHDFLDYALTQIIENNKKHDAIVGNPPFIRYQFLEKDFQDKTEQLFKILGQKFTKHTNAWVPFVLSCIELLKPNGRLGMVIPSEIINVMHAESLRNFLISRCQSIELIDPKEIWFEGTLQGAVILFVQKKESEHDECVGIKLIQVDNLEFLDEPFESFRTKFSYTPTSELPNKWTKACLNPQELELLNRISNLSAVKKFSEIAKVEVGIVTGANDFFLVNDDLVKEYDLEDFVYPMFGRSQHCDGILYDQKQHQSNKNDSLPNNFVWIKGSFENLPSRVQDYIKFGESKELHTRYKCRIRSPWYTVPSVFSTKLSMLKRAHEVPRIIFNELDAYTTDTAYRVSTSNIDEKKLAFLFLNPLTAIYCEIEGRSYGGGVLELVPSEIRNIRIPIVDIDFDLHDLDQNFKTLTIIELMKLQGTKIFSKLDISQKDIDLLVNIWIKLKDRRQRN